MSKADSRLFEMFHVFSRALAENLGFSWDGEIWHHTVNSQGLWSWTLYSGEDMAEQAALTFLRHQPEGKAERRHVIVDSSQSLLTVLRTIGDKLSRPYVPSPYRVTIGRIEDEALAESGIEKRGKGKLLLFAEPSREDISIDM